MGRDVYVGQPRHCVCTNASRGLSAISEFLVTTHGGESRIHRVSHNHPIQGNGVIECKTLIIYFNWFIRTMTLAIVLIHAAQNTLLTGETSTRLLKQIKFKPRYRKLSVTAQLDCQAQNDE